MKDPTASSPRGLSAFEGAYGGIDDFLAGQEAIGLPSPHFRRHVHRAQQRNDSDITWETSNYGGIKTIPRLEWECVANPDMNKIYPGDRLPIKSECFSTLLRLKDTTWRLTMCHLTSVATVCFSICTFCISKAKKLICKY